MTSTLFRDVFVVVSVVTLLALGLSIMLTSGYQDGSSDDRQPRWRRIGATVSQSLMTLAGWGAAAALVQHVVGPKF